LRFLMAFRSGVAKDVSYWFRLLRKWPDNRGESVYKALLGCDGMELTSCLSWFCNEKISSSVVQVELTHAVGFAYVFTLVPSRARIWRKLHVINFVSTVSDFLPVKLDIEMKL